MDGCLEGRVKPWEECSEINKARIIVQGGAYSKKIYNVKTRQAYLEGIRNSARQGYDVLREGGTAVDAVEKAVRVLENDTTFNAGRGSCLNKNGEVECDAMIMDGRTMKTGAVIAARHFPNPVTISRKIMEETSHCVLTGEGALEFAQKKGYSDMLDDPNTLKEQAYLGENFDHFDKFVKLHHEGIAVAEESDEVKRDKGDEEGDTVSAIAMDKEGYLACANSTGGIPGKLKGRVGDVPMVGCGGYANKVGAAATSGHGEAMMKMTLAREVVYNMEREQSAQEATENAIKKMQDDKDIKGYGGAIAIDRNGNVGKAHSTELMIWASIEDGKSVKYGELQNEEHTAQL